MARFPDDLTHARRDLGERLLDVARLCLQRLGVEPDAGALDVGAAAARQTGDDGSPHVHRDTADGLRVRLGSDVWDGSVQSRLEALKQS